MNVEEINLQANAANQNMLEATIAEVEKKTAIDAAKRLKHRAIPIAIIGEATGLSVEQIESLEEINDYELKITKEEARREKAIDIAIYLMRNEEIDMDFNIISEVTNLPVEALNDLSFYALKDIWDRNAQRSYAIEEEIEAGKEKKAIDTALDLKQKGVSFDIIVEATGLTLEQIQAL